MKKKLARETKISIIVFVNDEFEASAKQRKLDSEKVLKRFSLKEKFDKSCWVGSLTGLKVVRIKQCKLLIAKFENVFL